MPATTEYEMLGTVGVIRYRSLNGLPWLLNAFSTREGGVSEGQYASMNLSYTVGDDPTKVDENFRIFGAAIGVSPEQMVYAHQTHTDHVLKVGAVQRGMGVTRERDFHDIDGLVTNEPGVCLVTSFADCVPLYFADPVHRAIGMTHSGWRGTVAGIGNRTMELMQREYSSRPEDLIVCIGPCIGGECYEVSGDVAAEFEAAYSAEQYERICRPEPGREGKFMLDLPQANFERFTEYGVMPEHISMPDLCTACNADILHSHRASGGKRGGMCGFLMIR